MQAIEVKRHSRITQHLVPSTTALSFVCCSQFACKKKLFMSFGTTLLLDKGSSILRTMALMYQTKADDSSKRWFLSTKPHSISDQSAYLTSLQWYFEISVLTEPLCIREGVQRSAHSAAVFKLFCGFPVPPNKGQSNSNFVTFPTHSQNLLPIKQPNIRCHVIWTSDSVARKAEAKNKGVTISAKSIYILILI